MSSKKQLLDPVGTMCRLITLNFRSKGTRIGNNNHAIVIQLPSSIQWVQRRLNGDERDNISSLFSVIIRIIEWYVTPLYNIKFRNKRVKIDNNLKIDSANKDINTEDILKDTYISVEENEVEPYWDCLYKLCNFMCSGLSRLQETYEFGNVVYSLQFYINLIMDSLEGKYTREKLPKCIISYETRNLLDYNKIKDLWNYKRIKEICELYEKCFDAQKDTKDTEEHKREKIQGYLLAAEHLLNISDEEFRDLIELSQQD